ncbi:unnamed protein product, partial [Cuscuta europaea]
MHKMHLLSVSLLYNNSFLNYDQTLFSGKRVTRQPGDAPMSRVPPGLGLEGDTSRPGGHDGRVIAAWTIGNEVNKEGEEKNEWRKKRKEIADGKKKVFENNASPRSSSIFYSKVNCNSVSTKQTSSSSVLSPKLNISETSSRQRSIYNTSVAYD